MSALPGGHYCKDHQGNHSHYDPNNCTVCRLRAENEQLIALALDFVCEDDDCYFDHHGYCQAHGWFEIDPRCPHARVKELKP